LRVAREALFDPWHGAWALGDVLVTTHAPAAHWQQRQAQRLAQLVDAAATGSRWFRERLRGLRPATDTHALLAQLPVTRKRELMAHFDQWVADPALSLDALRTFTHDPARRGEVLLGRYQVWESSGSSGEPALFVQDARALAVADALEAARGPLTLLDAGLPWTPSWSGATRMAYVAALEGHFAGVVSFERLRTLNPWFGASARAFSFLQPIDALAEQLNAFAPTVLSSYPSMAWVLAQAQADGRLTIAPRAVWTGGETLTPGLRRAIGEAFHAPVRDSYGASECLTIASECRCGRLHLNADWVILEPVDERGRAVPEGEVGATTLLTNLANRVQPILRYELGDRVRFVPGGCACGSTLPVIEVEGRCDDVLTLADAHGHAVHIAPLALSTVLEDEAGVFDFRLRQRGPATLQLELGARESADAATRERAAQALRGFLRAQGLGAVHVSLRHGTTSAARGRSGKQCRIVRSGAGGLSRP
jgi:phenylacetate-CoA ligase